MNPNASLQSLEADVLARIATHRKRGARGAGAALPVGIAVIVCALAAGLGTGLRHLPRQAAATNSESVVLAEEASLAPSTLLVSSR
jgi:hypothetical protein